MKFAFSACVWNATVAGNIYKAKLFASNCSMEEKQLKRKRREWTKIMFPQKRTLWICPFFYFLMLLSGTGS